MAFADFQLKTAVKAFDLSEDRKTDLFRHVEPIEPSEHLRGWLAEFAPVALGINTEQARRENIIAPILAESKRKSRVEINVLPGVMLTVDSARGLTGYCDYLIARSPEFYLRAVARRGGRRGQARGLDRGARPVRRRDGRDPALQ